MHDVILFTVFFFLRSSLISFFSFLFKSKSQENKLLRVYVSLLLSFDAIGHNEHFKDNRKIPKL